MSTQIRVLKGSWVRTPRLMCSSAKNLRAVPPFKKYPFFAVLVAALLFAGCQKEDLNNPVLNSTSSNTLSATAAVNTPPKVDAGLAKRVVYTSTASTSLSGSGSAASGSVTFQWTQIGGNSTATIAQPTRSATKVSNLIPGIYTFTLTVTDNTGASSVDTTTVSVLEKMTWTIEGVTREALVHSPSGGTSTAAPIIFAFHGHSGTDIGFADKGFELSWPEAIVVYPQGLPTTSHSDPTAQQTGWQHAVGEVNPRTGIKDQDLKFFDAMLSTFKQKYIVNASQVFAHGWSNGSEFIYDVLWATRGDQLTALAPAAGTLNAVSGKKPLPVIHTAGTSDKSVSFSLQQRSVQNVRTLDQCSSTGSTWASGASGTLGTHYASPINNPVVFLQYNGPHSYPSTVPPLIVKFFKEVAGVE